MKPELQEKALQYLETMEGAVTASKDFVAREAPLVVQEYLQWCFWEACLWVVIDAVAVTLIMTVWTRACRRFADDGGDEFGILGIGVGWLAAGGFVLSAIFNAMAALQITIAPRVFLLERLAELVK